MNTNAQIKTIEQKLQDLLADEPGYFIVEIRINAGNNVKIFVDADQGASIDKLVHYNRALYKQIEGSALFPENNFSLEVSSPGLDEPLKLQRQYVKNKGRFVEVIQNDGTRTEGRLLATEDDRVTVEEEIGKGKKMEKVQRTISLDNIKSTKIQIKF